MTSTLLVTREDAQKLSFLSDINEGFRLPDEAYVHGKDYRLMEQLGSNCYFSNYWYGPSASARDFANCLAQHFKLQYDKMPVDPDKRDFFGMVMLWDNGQFAMVGNINLEQDVMIGDSRPCKKPEKWKRILNDFNDNSPEAIEGVSKKVKKSLVWLVAREHQEYFLESIEEE